MLSLTLFACFAFCCANEFIRGDSWGHWQWQRSGSHSLTDLWHLALDSYRYGNPRLGQQFTAWLFLSSSIHTFVTPMLVISLFYGIVGLALGRLPSVRRSDDLFAMLALLAIAFTAVWNIADMYFYRPVMGNYTLGLWLHVAVLLPYRFALQAPKAWRWWWLLPWSALGVAAGLANEHTGPATICITALAALWTWRTQRRVFGWMLVGTAALTVGFALLYFAPGQHQRYDGLASQVSIAQRILQRGAGNFLIVGKSAMWVALGTLPLLLAGGLAAAATRFGLRTRLRFRHGEDIAALPPPSATSNRDLREESPAVERAAICGLLTWSFLTSCTIMASPKLGWRLHFAGTMMLSAAVIGFANIQLRALAKRDSHKYHVIKRATAAAAAGIVLYAMIRLVHAHAVIGPMSADRVEALTRSQGQVLTLPAVPLARTRWWGRDELLNPVQRAQLGARFQLTELRVK